MKQALLYTTSGERVICNICHHRCSIPPNKTGICGTRINKSGKLYTLIYDQMTSVACDPIEKKPLFHFHPGSYVHSYGTLSCNFRCDHCLSGDSFIFTSSGVMSLEQIFNQAQQFRIRDDGVWVGEFLNAAPRVLTHSGRFLRISRAFKHSYSGELMRVIPAHFPQGITCTPYHEFLVWRNGSISRIRAGKLRRGDLLVIPRIKTRALHILELNIPKWKLSSSNLISILEGRIQPRSLGMHPNIHDLRKSSREGLEVIHDQLGYRGNLMAEHGIKLWIPMDAEFMKLAGYYLAGGCVNRNSIEIRLRSEQIDDAIKLFNHVFNQIPRLKNDDFGGRLILNNAIAASAFERLFGRDDASKRIPNQLLEAPWDLQVQLLRGFLGGLLDERKPSMDSLQLSSRSAQLIHSLGLILIKRGLIPIIYNIKRCRGKSIGNLWRLHLNRKWLEVLIRDLLEERSIGASKLEWSQYLVPVISIQRLGLAQTHVYDLEVEDDHSYLANGICVHNCQNKSISHVKPGEISTYTITPQRAVQEAIQTGCSGIAWTYNEPTIWFEFTYDCAKLAKQHGLYTVYVTNGYITPEALEMIAPYLDAANVDVKAWTQEFYSKVCGAKLEHVLQTCEMMHKLGIHLEIAYLIIPTRNDQKSQIQGFCDWVVGLDPEIPVHFTRFFPFYNPDLWETPIDTLEMALNLGYKSGLEYVYIGNVWGHKNESTYCPDCGSLLIKRMGFQILQNRLDEQGRCPDCGRKIKIVR